MHKLWGVVWLSAAGLRGASTGGVRATDRVCSPRTRCGSSTADVGGGPAGGLRGAATGDVRLGARISPSPKLLSPVT